MEAVRPATAADGPRVGELVAELVTGLAALRGGPLLVAAGTTTGAEGSPAGWLSDRMADPTWLVLVGTLDRAVTGFACAHVSDQPGGGRRGVLDACYVEPGARGVGLGHLLLDAALGWLDAAEVDGVDGTALPGDRLAKNFYESAGFKARLLTMHRPRR